VRPLPRAQEIPVLQHKTEEHEEIPQTPQQPEPVILDEIRSHADSGNLDEALLLGQRYISRNVADPKAYYIMGVICQALDRSEGAEDYLLKAIYLNPDYYEALIHLSLLYEQRGERARAALYMERAQRFSGKERNAV